MESARHLRVEPALRPRSVQSPQRDGLDISSQHPVAQSGGTGAGLPLPQEVRYLISYFLYFVELSLSLILLFRFIGLAPLEAIFCAQIYVLILFPPSNGTFVTLYWYSLAPVNAHLVAIWNVLFVLLLVTGRYGVSHALPALCSYWFAEFSPHRSHSKPMPRYMPLPA